MTLLEAEVHSSLLRFLRSQSFSPWPHHLTMARMVARTLRLQKSAIIQTSSANVRYSFSYLTPALITPQPVILVAPEAEQVRLVEHDIPTLQRSLGTAKVIISGDRSFPREDFSGLFLTSPQVWLKDRLENLGYFPPAIPTLIDQADELGILITELLTPTLTPEDWLSLRQNYPEQLDFIQSQQAKLTHLFFSRPPNPYGCLLLDDLEKAILQELSAALRNYLPWETSEKILWASLDRTTGNFTLHLTPANIAPVAEKIWPQQPIVLMGGFLDSQKEAFTYRQELGIQDLLCLKFSNTRNTNGGIILYIPARLPMPNTPQFQDFIFAEIDYLVDACWSSQSSIVILTNDLPLKPQLGTTLAAKYGSIVQVEKNNLVKNNILICSWQYWLSQQDFLVNPQLLILCTLPIPSPENPLVAGRIAYYKQKKQDWFSRYLLPTALKEMERAITPMRETQGIVALLDNRVNLLSYGSQILSLLEPYARINYLDKNVITSS
jgi:ATP-dependent DNA helicase DinG